MLRGGDSMPDLERAVVAAFRDVIRQKMLWGIEPVSDGVVHFEVSDPKMKVLILAHLWDGEDPRVYLYPYPYEQKPRVHTHRFKVNYSYEEEVGDSVYPTRLPFICRTFLDHWMENKHILLRKMFIRFIEFRAGNDVTERYWKTICRQRLRDIEEQIRNAGYDRRDVLLIPMWGKVGENIGEFISLFYFRKLGYLTTVLAPFTGPGVPDVTCWKTPLTRKLRDAGIVDNGATLYELSMLRIFGKIQDDRKDSSDRDEAIVVEVESERPYPGTYQLLGNDNRKGYVSEGNYDKAFVCVAFCKNVDRVGLLSFDHHGLVVRDCPENFSVPECKAQSISEIDDLIKMVLVTNLTFDEILRLIGPTKPKTFFQVLNAIVGLDEDRLIEKVKKVMGKEPALETSMLHRLIAGGHMAGLSRVLGRLGPAARV